MLGSFHFHWAPTPMLFELEADEGFTRQELLQGPGGLEGKAFGRVTHGDGPTEE
jgi:hypothetical protein